MASVEVRNFDSPDEVRPFVDKGNAVLVTIAGREVARGVFEPGWRWSDHVKPIAGTESCQHTHLMYVASGRMRITMDDGSQTEVGPGDVVSVPPGHDAEVIGRAKCVTINLDASGDADYAKWS